ncbi:MAG: glycoside hydrolase family 43 protein, partial [Gemmatimonadaceae bacterium]
TPHEPTILASKPLGKNFDGTIYLKIVARNGKYDFFYGDKPDGWKLLANEADGTMLSTKVSQGFVGVMFGLYAFTPGN